MYLKSLDQLYKSTAYIFDVHTSYSNKPALKKYLIIRCITVIYSSESQYT
jgi:hypothetical protein